MREHSGRPPSGRGPPAKRPRLEDAGRRPPIPDVPLHLLATPSVDGPMANEGMVGITLRDLVCGTMELVFISSLGLDMAWLLGECPALKGAGHLTVCVRFKEASVDSIQRDLQHAGRQGDWVHWPRIGELQRRGGCHHSKFFLIQYRAGLRVIILSANLESRAYDNSACSIRTSPPSGRASPSPETPPRSRTLRLACPAICASCGGRP